MLMSVITEVVVAGLELSGLTHPFSRWGSQHVSSNWNVPSLAPFSSAFAFNKFLIIIIELNKTFRFVMRGNRPPVNSVYPILYLWVFYSFSSPASQEFPFWSLKQKSNPHTILAACHEKVTLQSFCLNWLRGGNPERCCVWIGNKSNVTICWQSFVPTSTIPETGNIDCLNLNTVDQVLHLHTRCKSNEPINLKLICVGMWDIVGVLGNGGFQLFSTADWKRQGLLSIHV